LTELSKFYNVYPAYPPSLCAFGSKLKCGGFFYVKKTIENDDLCPNR